MDIRYGSDADAIPLADLAGKTYFETYVEFTGGSKLGVFIKKNFTSDLILRELSDPANIFLIAEVDGEMAGYVKLLLNEKERSMIISKIYLLSKFAGKGNGTALMNRVKREARSLGCKKITLEVWDRNKRAVQFYRKVGFKETGSAPFEFEGEIHTDLVMELML